jgi:hypothetical protein
VPDRNITFGPSLNRNINITLGRFWPAPTQSKNISKTLFTLNHAGARCKIDLAGRAAGEKKI